MVDQAFLSDHARSNDDRDPLRDFRDQFWIPRCQDSEGGAAGQEICYLVGNSLGLMPKQTADFVNAELEAWRREAVAAHFSGKHPWMPYHEFLTEPMAALVGALPSEVVMMNSLTANLHLALATFYRPVDNRHQILIEDHAFPSDHYAVESQIRWHDLDPAKSLIIAKADPSSGQFDIGKLFDLIEENRETLSVLVLPGVQYYTGQVFPIAEIVKHAHRWGIIVGIDLAHAAGNLELRLHDWDVDFAVWCTYKYLNSGPGSVAGFYVHERHAANQELPRLAGWWGHDKTTRFLMGTEFRPIATAEGWQLSNPPILSLAAIRSSLDIFQRAGGLKPLVEKSRRMNQYFREQLQQHCAGRIKILTPIGGGCQLSLRVEGPTGWGKRVKRELDLAGIETDWREPDVIRAAPVPLYNRFADIDYFVFHLRRILEQSAL